MQAGFSNPVTLSLNTLCNSTYIIHHCILLHYVMYNCVIIEMLLLHRKQRFGGKDDMKYNVDEQVTVAVYDLPLML